MSVPLFALQATVCTKFGLECTVYMGPSCQQSASDNQSVLAWVSVPLFALQATVCAKFGLECIVYMGAKDMERQKLNVFWMRLLGAEVRPVHSGTATLKDATSEAIRDWVTNVETTHYILGSAAGPHPYPMMVSFLRTQTSHVMVDPVTNVMHPHTPCVDSFSYNMRTVRW